MYKYLYMYVCVVSESKIKTGHTNVHDSCQLPLASSEHELKHFFSLYEGYPTLLTSDEDVIRDVMVKEFNNFTNRKVKYRAPFFVMQICIDKTLNCVEAIHLIGPRDSKHKRVISEYMLRMKFKGSSCEVALKWVL